MYFSPGGFTLKGEIVLKNIYLQGITSEKLEVASHFRITDAKGFICQILFHLSFSIIGSIADALTTSVSDATENFTLNCCDYNWFNRLFSTFLGKTWNFKCFVLKSSQQSSDTFHGQTNTSQLLFQF